MRPRPSSAHLPLLLGTFLASACGSRSALHELDAAAGSQGGTASGGSAAGGSAGAGGSGGEPDPRCDEIIVTGAPISLTATSGGLSQRKHTNPTLAFTRDDLSRVVAFFTLPFQPGMSTPGIAGTAFDPWGDWPQSLGPGEQVVYTESTDFAISQGFDDRFSLLWTSKLGGSAGGMFFGSFSLPLVDQPSLPVTNKLGKALFVTRGETNHMLGYGYPGFRETAGIMGTELTPSSTANDCPTSDPRLADAFATGNGYILAVSAVNETGDDTGCTGPTQSTRLIQLSRIDSLGGATPLSIIQPASGGPIRSLDLVPRKDGRAWLVWQTSTAPTPVLHAAIIDAAGNLISSEMVLSAEGQVPARHALTALGNHLLLAYTEPSLSIALVLFDDSGLGVTYPFPGQPPAAFDDQINLLARPGSGDFLIAYPSDSLMPQPPQTVVARLTCVEAK